VHTEDVSEQFLKAYFDLTERKSDRVGGKMAW